MKICPENTNFVTIRKKISHFTQTPKLVSLLPTTFWIANKVLSVSEQVG